MTTEGPGSPPAADGAGQGQLLASRSQQVARITRDRGIEGEPPQRGILRRRAVLAGRLAIPGVVLHWLIAHRRLPSGKHLGSGKHSDVSSG